MSHLRRLRVAEETGAAGKACVISTLNGDTNVPFFKEFANAGLTSENCPVVSFSISEDEFRGLPAKDLVGHLGCWTYFMSIKSPENTKFVKDFLGWVKAPKVTGIDYTVSSVDAKGRVTCSPMNLSRMSVYLWKQAVEKAGSFKVDKVRAHDLDGDDQKRAEEIGNAVRMLRKEAQISILLVEQYLDFCLDVGDNFYIMDRGSIVAEEPIAKLNDDIVKQHLTV